MFNWGVKARCDTFWIQGVRNYCEELEFYEMPSQLGPDTGNNGPGHATNHAGASTDLCDDGQNHQIDSNNFFYFFGQITPLTYGNLYRMGEVFCGEIM